MMYSWRISKYNSKNRGNKGAYLIEEWTSVSDIGREFNSQLFLLEEYLKVEESYLNELADLINIAGENLFKIESLEKQTPTLKVIGNDFVYSDKEYDLYSEINDGLIVKIEDALLIAKLVLREDLWCKLVGFDGDIEIHFGYDYYMYVVSSKNLIGQKHNKSFLYVEEFESPYID